MEAAPTVAARAATGKGAQVLAAIFAKWQEETSIAGISPLHLRMQNLRRFRVALLFLLALSPLASLAEKVATMPAPTGYINDYAGVLTAPAKSELEDLCRELHDKAKAQLFVVTIKT